MPSMMCATCTPTPRLPLSGRGLGIYTFLLASSSSTLLELEAVLSLSSSAPIAPCTSSSKTGSVSMVSNLVLKSLAACVLELLRRRGLFML